MTANQKGISHLLLPLIIILVAAIAGTFYLVSSKADQVTAAPTLASATDQADLLKSEDTVRTIAPTSSGASARTSSTGLKTVKLNIHTTQLRKCTKDISSTGIAGIVPPYNPKYWGGEPNVYTCSSNTARKVSKSDADLMVGLYKGSKVPTVMCNGFVISKGVFYNFGHTRKLVCKTSQNTTSLHLRLRGAAEFHYGKNGSKYAWPDASFGYYEGVGPYLVTYDSSNYYKPNKRYPWVAESYGRHEYADRSTFTVTLGSVY